jgi:predicted PurR-regulated permease PerM
MTTIPISAATRWYIFAGIVFTGIMIYLLAPVLSPFLTGALLAYLGDPVVDWLEKHKLPRTGAVVIVFVAIILVVAILPFVLIPLIEAQLSSLVAKLPEYIDYIESSFIPLITETLHIDRETLSLETLKQAVLHNWREVGGIAGKIVNTISQSGLAVLALIANLVLVPVVTFYMLRDWDDIVAKVHALLPRKHEPTITKLAKDSDEVLGAFIRGQLMVMIALGVIYSIGLSIMGLDLAILIGMIAGLVSFVPYLGSIVGILLAGVATVMQFQDVVYLLAVAVVFGVGQGIEGMLLTPLLVGDKIGLHPVAVIFAVMAGGQLFGFVGVLLALPVAAVVMVLLRHGVQQYRASTLYETGDEKSLE